MTEAKPLYHCCVCQKHYEERGEIGYIGEVNPEVVKTMIEQGYQPTSGFCKEECYKVQLDMSGLPERDVIVLLQQYQEKKVQE